MKTTIGVIFGGVSNEYTVSLRTCASIIQNIDKNKYDTVLIGITKEGRWLATNANAQEIKADRWQENAVTAILSPDPSHKGLVVLEDGAYRHLNLDCLFPAVHGQNCEDGVLQGLMELSGLPYVGCGVASSACCFDKEITHIIAEAAGIAMAKSFCLRRWQHNDPAATQKLLEEKIGYPMFVKPCCSGSSVGASKAVNPEELHKALELAFAQDEKIIVEEMIVGREVECAVLGNLELSAPVVGEVEAVGGFYDFDSKYINSTANIIIPARLSEAVSLQVRTIAQKIFLLLGCRGLSRVDFFVTKDDKVIFNEINTLPGFTSISMYPQMMIYGGMTYTELITALIELAIEDKRMEA